MVSTSCPFHFPLLGKTARLDYDSDGFKRFDLGSECPIPIAGRGHPGAFAHARRHHIHEGIDLYGEKNDEVVALFSGLVVFNGPFTGALAGSPWWNATSAIAIENERGVLFHGEIDALDIPLGAQVMAGDRLGRLERVLLHDKGRPLHMLHLELYTPGTRQSIGLWPLGTPQPSALLDPTPLILKSAGF